VDNNVWGNADVWTNAGVILATVLIGIGGYLSKKYFADKNPTSSVPASPVLAGIGLELAQRDHYDKLVTVQTRIAVALETLADRKIAKIDEMQQELLERLDIAEALKKEQKKRTD
jgi:hypothetical protein